jgi:hypothetical protein
MARCCNFTVFIKKEWTTQMFGYYINIWPIVTINDPESYAGGSIATGRAPMPDRKKVMTQTKRYTLVLQVVGWA